MFHCYLPLILFAMGVPISSEILTIKESPANQKINEMTLRIVPFLKAKQHTALIISNGKMCDVPVNEYLKQLSSNPVVVSHEPSMVDFSKIINREQFIYLFVDSVEKLWKYLQCFSHDTFQNVKALLHFTICCPVDDEKWVKELLEHMWEKRIINVLLTYYYKRLVTLQYNPFLDTIAEITPNTARNIFKSKLHNMNGHKLRVSLFADAPRIVERNGQFYGMDPMILKGFGERLNATIEIVIPHGLNTDDKLAGQHYDIQTGKVDFGFTTIFKVSEIKSVSTTYPRRMDDIVILVPYASEISEYKYLFILFGGFLSLYVLASYVTIVLYKMLYTRCFPNEQHTVNDWLLETWSILFGVPVPTVHEHFPVKFVFFMWALCSMVFSAIWMCLQTSTSIKRPLEKNIDTLSELAKTNKKLLIHKYIMHIVKDHYPLDLLVPLTAQEIVDCMRAGNTTVAYAVLKSVAEIVTRTMSRNGRPLYHVLREHLISSFSVYMFPHNSPYLDEVNKYISLDQQFGLSKFTYENYAFIKSEAAITEDSNVALDFVKLGRVFWWLSAGLLVSFIVFLIEIIHFKSKRHAR